MDAHKQDLHRYLQQAREAVLWKLDGLSERDVRRPMTRTGTNLLGLVKHLAAVELGYFGVVFGRPADVAPPWSDDDPLADLWATAEESREHVVGLYRTATDHADRTIEELPLDALGRVPWWQPGRDEVSLHRVLVHVTTETHRHAGHADVVRELLDGAVGLRPDGDNLPDDMDDAAWAAHVERLEQVARGFTGS